MFLCACDICGALDDVEGATREGTSSLLIHRGGSADPLARMMGTAPKEHVYQFCRECTTQFIALLAARKAARI